MEMEIKKRATGVDCIAYERYEQKQKHGYSEKNDFENNKNYELSGIATFLCLHDYEQFDILTEEDFKQYIPENWDFKRVMKMIRKPLKERLVIAGALIAAEIDRLNYTE